MRTRSQTKSRESKSPNNSNNNSNNNQINSTLLSNKRRRNGRKLFGAAAANNNNNNMQEDNYDNGKSKLNNLDISEKSAFGILKRSFTFVNVSRDEHFNLVVSWAFFLILVCSLAENLQPTSYGRFGENLNPTFAVTPRLGWWLMELPVTVVFTFFYFIKPHDPKSMYPENKSKTSKFLAFMMLCHYAYRGWYYPYNLRVSGTSKSFSLVPAVGGWIVTSTHGYLNAKWFRYYGTHLNDDWMKSFRFRLGVFLYYTGFIMLMYHDSLVRNLRGSELLPGEVVVDGKYRVTRGGFFEYVTAAAYFVELWAWLGFAITSWGPNGVFIFLVSCVNLIPRAVTTHAWYVNKFGKSYPAERGYLIPFVW